MEICETRQTVRDFGKLIYQSLLPYRPWHDASQLPLPVSERENFQEPPLAVSLFWSWLLPIFFTSQSPS